MKRIAVWISIALFAGLLTACSVPTGQTIQAQQEPAAILVCRFKYIRRKKHSCQTGTGNRCAGGMDSSAGRTGAGGI